MTNNCCGILSLAFNISSYDENPVLKLIKASLDLNLPNINDH